MLYDRNTNIADAIGHVVLVSPDGQIVYSNYAELSQNMTNGIMSTMNITLPQNAKLAANGGRRTEGQINELSRAVYTACDVCAKHPDRYPLWEINARSATQDVQHHLIEYKDATMEDLRISNSVVSVFLASRPEREAHERPAHPVRRLQHPSRGLRRTALLLGHQ